jgi:anaerobic selenocysteine-containing dehydrogenase
VPPGVERRLRDRGGGLARSTHALQLEALDLASVERPDLAVPGVRSFNMSELGRDLCDPDLDPPIRALLVHGANPAVSMPNQRLVQQGLRRDDLFTVVHDLFVTDTALYADYVLPATSQIEHLDLGPAWGHLYLALNRPAIAPCGEAVSNTELFRRLARALGRTEPWLFESDEAMVRTALASGHPWLDGITYERLWDEGYARLARPDDWRPFANGGFPTASGKAELFSETLAAQGLDPLPGPGDIAIAAGLRLISGKTLHYLNSSYGHIDRHRRREGAPPIEIHADDAGDRGLATGDAVSVTSARGSVEAICRVSDRVARGVVWMPFGGLYDAAGARQSVNALTAEEPTDWGGGSGLYDTFVEVSRAGAALRPA